MVKICGKEYEFISIHAPARGATRRIDDSYSRKRYFNSRPCERGDDCFRCLCLRFFISIHAPARGATAKLAKQSSCFAARLTK